MVTPSVIPLLAVLVSSLGAILIACTGERRANLREFWSFAAGVAMFALVASMIPEVLAHRPPESLLFLFLPRTELPFSLYFFACACVGPCCFATRDYFGPRSSPGGPRPC